MVKTTITTTVINLPQPHLQLRLHKFTQFQAQRWLSKISQPIHSYIVQPL